MRAAILDACVLYPAPLAVLRGQVASLRNPPTTLADRMDRLASQGLREAMVAMRGHRG